MLHGGGVLTLHDTHKPDAAQSLALPEYRVYPECPLAASIDGLRLATGGEHGLILWERETTRDPFRPPRQTAANEGSFDRSAVLEFSHDGQPVVLTILGELVVYDWKLGVQRKRISLGATQEPSPSSKARWRAISGRGEERSVSYENR
jgi:hypothetical protein